MTLEAAGEHEDVADQSIPDLIGKECRGRKPPGNAGNI